MDWHTRLVYIGLWSYVDDNGVGRDKEQLVTAALFPLDEALRESSRRVTGALRHLSDHGQITRYVVDGKPFLHVTAWTTHQRIEKASKGRYPLPTCDKAEITEPSRNTPGALPDMSTLGEGEKGRRGEGEKSSSSDTSDSPDRFDDFWATYGYKIKRADAAKAWAKAVKKADADQIITAAAAYVKRVRADKAARGDRAPDQAHASSWLNAERWADEPDGGNIHYLPGGEVDPSTIVWPEHQADWMNS
ncbi:hypothetical protein [Nocardioides aurantiacus]|nr:hypothetical protein [Nocardioides aurantiacus]